jgi:hypothetical protein
VPGAHVDRRPGLLSGRERSRLIYRTMLHRGRKGEKEGFRESDFAALLDAAHQQLAGPIVLVWDNLHGHVSVAMRALIAAGPGCACTPSRPTHPNSTRSKACGRTSNAVWPTPPLAPSPASPASPKPD